MIKRSLTGLALILLIVSCGSGSATSDTEEIPVDSKYAPGKEVYDHACIACHMKDGLGLEGTFPPLKASDYLLSNPQRALTQVIEGSSGEMIVNGVIYNSIMPAQDVTEQEAVDVVNYILNAWGNDGGEVSKADL